MQPPVQRSADFDRILALPTQAPQIERWQSIARAASWEFLNPAGRKALLQAEALPPEQCAAKLQAWADSKRPLLLQWEQVWMIYTVIETGRLWCHGPVGVGKTLAYWIIAYVLEHLFGIERALLVVNGSGKNQSFADMRKLADVWESPTNLKIETYQKLSHPNHAFLLCGCELCVGKGNEYTGEQHRPQALLLDEAQNAVAKICRKRINRFRRSHRVPVYPASGSMHWGDYRPMFETMIWALGWEAPAPHDFLTQQAWCNALNEKLRSESERMPPGVLLQFADSRDDHLSPIDAARTGLARKQKSTPGIVMIETQSCDKAITIEILEADPDPILDGHFETLRKGHAPDGRKLMGPLEKYLVATQMGNGYHRRWRNRPPQEWLDAREEARDFVEEKMDLHSRGGRKPLDSEKMVFDHYPDAPEVLAWIEAKAAFVPDTVDEMISLSYVNTLRKAIDLLEPCLIWTPHVWTGTTLSRLTGIPYFSSQGKTDGGLSIENYDPKHSAIMANKANTIQRNLQGWYRNVYAGMTGSTLQNEQRLGRTHRRNQKYDVEVYAFAGCGEHINAIEDALRVGKSVQIATSAQKILQAAITWTMPDEIRYATIDGPSVYRWVR